MRWLREAAALLLPFAGAKGHKGEGHERSGGGDGRRRRAEVASTCSQAVIDPPIGVFFKASSRPGGGNDAGDKADPSISFDSRRKATR